MASLLTRLTNVLNKRATTPACPFCATNSWTPVGDEESVGLVTMGRHGSPISFGAGFLVLVLICDGCGFVRQHAVESLKP